MTGEITSGSPAPISLTTAGTRQGPVTAETQGSGYLEAVRREYLGWATARNIPILDATRPPAVLAGAAFSIVRSAPVLDAMEESA